MRLGNGVVTDNDGQKPPPNIGRPWEGPWSRNPHARIDRDRVDHECRGSRPNSVVGWGLVQQAPNGGRGAATSCVQVEARVVGDRSSSPNSTTSPAHTSSKAPKQRRTHKGPASSHSKDDNSTSRTHNLLTGRPGMQFFAAAEGIAAPALEDEGDYWRCLCPLGDGQRVALGSARARYCVLDTRLSQGYPVLKAWRAPSSSSSSSGGDQAAAAAADHGASGFLRRLEALRFCEARGQFWALERGQVELGATRTGE